MIQFFRYVRKYAAKHGCRSALVGLLAMVAGVSHAQNVPAVAAITWTAPTMAADGSALGGAQALTEYHLFASQSAILDTQAAAPMVKIPPGNTSYQYTATVPNGSRLFFRLRACNLGGCSPLSAEVSKIIEVSKPGEPGAVTVSISITVTVTP